MLKDEVPIQPSYLVDPRINCVWLAAQAFVDRICAGSVHPPIPKRVLLDDLDAEQVEQPDNALLLWKKGAGKS
ncbi:hypothetical protein [Mesorhizobium sp. 43Arga]